MEKTNVIDFDSLGRLLDDVNDILKDEYTFLNSFWNPSQDCFAIRDPNSSLFNVSSTCLALSELLQSAEMLTKFVSDRTNQVGHTGKQLVAGTVLDRLRAKLEDCPWKTEDLPENNIYTSSMAIIALYELGSALDSHKARMCVQDMANTLKEAGGISLTGYRPHAFLTLLAMDAISSYLVRHPDEKGEHRAALDSGAEWAANELFAQMSYFFAEDFDRFDPAQLIYCLIMYDKYGSGLGQSQRIIAKGLEVAFNSRLPSGLWPQGRPVMHYGTRGDHYIFSFSLIGSLLLLKRCYPHEFAKYLDALDPFIVWARDNLKSKQFGNRVTVGWPSNLKPMPEEPECWSTAAVLSGLRGIKNLVQELINQMVLAEFHSIRTAASPAANIPTQDPFDEILDSEVTIGDSSVSFKDVMKRFFVEPRMPSSKGTSNRKNSALIFGPSGLTKTTWAEVIAKKLKWPLLYLHISDFVSPNISSAAPRIQYIFQRLQRLKHVVILFDDIEELVRRRDDKTLTAESRILTSTVLPFLQRLHKNSEVILIATTNYQEEFDAPVTRGERFDLILRAAPPTKQEKLRYFQKRMLDALPKEIVTEVSEKFHAIQHDKRLREEIEFLTYQEWKRFVDDAIECANKPEAISDTALMNCFLQVCGSLTIQGKVREDFLKSAKVSAIQS